MRAAEQSGDSDTVANRPKIVFSSPPMMQSLISQHCPGVGESYFRQNLRTTANFAPHIVCGLPGSETERAATLQLELSEKSTCGNVPNDFI